MAQGLDERKDQEILKPHGIYMAGRGRNELNVDDHSTLTINNYYNAIAWDGVDGGNEDSIYYHQHHQWLHLHRRWQ